MVATAVYYHFAGKEELFEAALAHVIDANSQVIRAARPDDAPASPDIFKVRRRGVVGLGRSRTPTWRGCCSCTPPAARPRGHGS